MISQLYSIHRKLLSNLKPSFKRDFTNQIDWNDRMVGISGARGVGKTTMILQQIKENCKSTECLYVSVDDVFFPYKNLITLAEDFDKLGGKILYIDEIHKFPKWSAELKNIYDRYPNLKVVFSGSSLLHITKGNTDLSRRAVIHKLPGLSFREFVQIETKEKYPKLSFKQLIENHEEISVSFLEKFKPLPLFQQYLKFGYYPFYLQSKKNYLSKLNQTFKETLESDISIIYGLDTEKLNKLKRFLFLISETVSMKINISSLASSLETNRTLVYEFLKYLSDAELISLLYSKNKGYKTMSKPEKVFLAHPNHYYALSESPNIGSLRESFFINQLSKTGTVNYTEKGDFLFDHKYTFEVGGTSKNYQQISDIENAYLAIDNIETGFAQKIPLWLFGFLG